MALGLSFVGSVMKIAKIEVFQVDLPYAGGVYVLSGGREYRSFDATFVRVTTDYGLQGWGESTPFGPNYIAAHALGVRSGIEEIAPMLIDTDALAVDRANDLMDQALMGHLHAKTAVDLALWDILGKATNLPCYQLLGGSHDVPMPRISSIYAGTPDDMRRRVQDHRARGYRGHSVKVGASEAEGGPALDAERIAASLADRQSGEFFLVDANGGLSIEHAKRMLRLLPGDADIVLEAPCATRRECQVLRHATQVPIIMDELATDEHSVADIISQNLADGIGLKISKAGGLTRGRRIRDLCQAAGLTMSVQDTVGSDISFAAICHLGATVKPQLLSCVLDTRDMVRQSVAAFEPVMDDGDVLPPATPGLGVEPDMDVMGDPVAIYD